MKKKAILYSRVAKGQMEVNSVVQQCNMEMLRKYAEEHHYEVVDTIEAVENGLSLERDGWKAAVAQAEKNHAQIILVNKFTRVARTMTDMAKAITALKAKGIEIESLQEGRLELQPLYRILEQER